MSILKNTFFTNHLWATASETCWVANLWIMIFRAELKAQKSILIFNYLFIHFLFATN